MTKIPHPHQPIWQAPGYDPETCLHQYRCVLTEPWYDADSPRALIDLGFNQWQVGPIKNGKPRGISLRLARINAWEVKGEHREKGLAARDFCRELIKPGDQFRIYTYRDAEGKYGRPLVDVKVWREEQHVCLNDWLVELGHAWYQEY